MTELVMSKKILTALVNSHLLTGAEGLLKIQEDGLKTSMGIADIGLMSVFVSNRDMENYTFSEEMNVGLDFNHISELLKVMSDKVRIKPGDGYVEIESGSYKGKIRTIDPQHISGVKKAPEMDLPNMFTVNASKAFKLLQVAKTLKLDDVEILMDDKKAFFTVGEQDKHTYTEDLENALNYTYKELARARFGVEYLHDFLKLATKYSMGGEGLKPVSMELKANFPVRAEFNIAENSPVTLVLAPRVDDEDIEWAEKRGVLDERYKKKEGENAGRD